MTTTQEKLDEALRKVAVIEIYRGMPADEAIERGIAATGIACNALAALAAEAAQPQAQAAEPVAYYLREYGRYYNAHEIAATLLNPDLVEKGGLIPLYTQPQPAQDAEAAMWRTAFISERQRAYVAQGMGIEQARIHAETDVARAYKALGMQHNDKVSGG